MYSSWLDLGKGIYQFGSISLVLALDLCFGTHGQHTVSPVAGIVDKLATVMNVFVILIMINLNVDQGVIVAETVNINQWEVAKACV